MKSKYKLRPNLSHFNRLVTKIGIWQHSVGNIPDKKHGYSIDDCARALIVAIQNLETYNDESSLFAIETNLYFIKRARIKGSYFHNFADNKGKFIDEVGSETSFGRTIWALGYLASKKKILPELAQEAEKILADLPPVDFEHPRSLAYAILGFYYLGDEKTVSHLADKLVSFYDKDKCWFDENLAYANAILPLALLLAYSLMSEQKYREVALESLTFLDSLTRKDGVLSPVSHLGWSIMSESRPVFDQQVIDVADMVLAAQAAYAITKKVYYRKMAIEWFSWFYGNNVNKQMMINERDGGVFDGITEDGVNRNQGAESTLCYLLAYFALVKSKVFLNF